MRIPLLLCMLSITLLSCNDNISNTIEDDTARALKEQLDNSRVDLANGWSLTPVGTSDTLGDLPLNLTVSTSGKYFAVTNNGQSVQSLMLYDAISKVKLSTIEIPKSWYGLHFSKDDTRLYASGGNDNMVRIYNIESNNLSLADSIILGEPWPNKVGPTGIEIDYRSNLLYVVTKEDSALYIADLSNNTVKTKIKLEHEAYTCLLNPAKDELYVSLWGGEKVAIYDLSSNRITHTIKVESHPNDMALTADGKYLFVANANSNSVSVIETGERKVLETISTSLYPDSPTGSTSNAVALNTEENVLYIANADNNCLAVFDIEHKGQSESLGFIPTGWYPTTVRVINDKILVTNGKGFTTKANPNGPNPYKKRDDKTEYIARMFTGTLSIIDTPNALTLSAYSKAVYENTPYNKEIEKTAEGEEGNPIPRKLEEPSPIKYVFYVIKENRTYDQVFGDMEEGNGDPRLCLFPDSISPNHHRLAKEFVLYDNFYVDAEVSADGHNWTTAAYSTDYTEKTWPTSYGQRGGTYDYEGSREIAYPVKGYIWDYCQRAGLDYRTYGEFIPRSDEVSLKSIDGHYDVDYPGYNLSIMDTFRINRWKHDFDSLLAIGKVPQFNSIRIGNDHTSGARIGRPSPRAMMADNDLALGMLVEHISKSDIWSESAIFVVEDDAQNGPDHVDAHRSVLLVASPYTRRGYVDHTMYSTSSVLRTMELILGLPPMSQYDAAATPLWRSFTPQSDLSAYDLLPNSYPLDEMNTEQNILSDLSASWNLEVEDAAPDVAFNEVIWKTIKGIDSEMPAPKRGAFVHLIEDEEEGEDD